MNKLFLLTSVASSVILTGCISLKSDSVGQEFEPIIDQSIEDAITAKPDAKIVAPVNANSGKSYQLGFKAKDAIYVASKDLTGGINGINADNNARAVGKATTLMFDKTNKVWDRIQGHAITVKMNLDASSSLTTEPKKEDFTIENVSMSYRGNLAKDKTGYTFADVTKALKDFKYDEEKIKTLLPDGVIANVGDVGNFFDPQIKHEPNFYGVYGSQETQYTAFYSSALPVTSKQALAKKSGTTEYKNLEFRGIAKSDETATGFAQTNLYGAGSANINFQTGAYNSTINVTKDKANPNVPSFGVIEFKGNAAAVKTNEAQNLPATFTKSGTNAVTNGNAEFAIYGDEGQAIMGSTDFTEGSLAIVGAFGAKPTNTPIE